MPGARPLIWITGSEHILNDLNSYKIQPGLHLDQIGNNNLTRSRGFWKFNTSMLHDKTYVEEIKKIIISYEKNNPLNQT